MLDEPTTPASSANGEKSPALEGLDEPASGSGDGPGDRRVQDPAADATQEQAGVEGGHEEENGEGRGMLGAEMTSRTWERVAVLPPRGLMAPPRKMSMPGMHRTSLVMPVTQLGVCSGTDYSTGGEDTDAGAHSLLSLEGGVQLCCFDSTGLPLCSLAHGTSLLPRARLGLIGAVYTSGTTSGIQLCSLDTEGACVRYMGMYRGRLIAVFILKSSSKCRGEMVHRLYQMFEGALNMLVGDAAMSVHLENIKVLSLPPPRPPRFCGAFLRRPPYPLPCIHPHAATDWQFWRFHPSLTDRRRSPACSAGCEALAESASP